VHRESIDAVVLWSGQFRWSVMPSELARLADELIALYNRFPEGGSVTFAPLEPNLSLSFSIRNLGRVEGTFSLRDDFVAGDELRGRFTMEQSMLPHLAKSIRTFVEAHRSLA